MDLLDLARGDTCLRLAPAVGGGIAGFQWQDADVMRPASEAALASRDPLGLASFPLVPWSNRIAHGRFRFDGRDVALPRNFGDHPHAIHGHGWQAPWTVAARDASSAMLSFDHAAADWPWAYRAEQLFTLADDGFDLRLSVENRSDRRMPAGLGHHPYFPKTPGMRLIARLDGWWETDGFIMPTAHVDEARDDWSDRLHAPTTTDNVFSGWDGRARLEWPERGLALTMTASAPAKWLVVYSPPDQAIACIEGVTHPTDALNDAALPGLAILAPGERFALETRFRVSVL
jgi:aldose 1-epimerase